MRCHPCVCGHHSTHLWHSDGQLLRQPDFDQRDLRTLVPREEALIALEAKPPVD
jgi:hypothetical protein